jgi:hypothetical protein
MRRLMLLVAALAVVTACSSSDGAKSASTTTSTLPLPGPLTEYLSRAKPPGEVAFSATFHVVRKLGGTETDVRVDSTPPTWRIAAGDIVVTGPPKPSTADEARLSATGVFSNFYSTGPAAAIAADARRKTAGAAVYSDRTVAGVDLACVAVPQAGVFTQTACLTPEGVFGYVDNAAVHIELTRYEVRATR